MDSASLALRLQGMTEAQKEASLFELLLGLHEKVDRLLIVEAHQVTDLTQIANEVAENGAVIDSAIVLLGRLSDEVRANATDPAALAALADSLDAQQDALAAAVVANTPAAPEPTPDPEPPAEEPAPEPEPTPPVDEPAPEQPPVDEPPAEPTPEPTPEGGGEEVPPTEPVGDPAPDADGGEAPTPEPEPTTDEAPPA